MMLRVCIAGPYSSNPERNVREALAVGEWVARLGHVPFIPHLTHYWHEMYPHEYEFWLKQDLEWLKVCDCLIRISGKRGGADKEVEWAKTHNLQVYSVTEFLQENYHG